MPLDCLNAFVDLVLPRSCCGCGSTAVTCAGLCSSCIQTLLNRHSAVRLGAPITGGWVLGPYEGTLRELIRAAKYGGDPRVAHHLGRWMAQMMPEHVDLVSWVPTRWTKQLSRGFDAVRAMSTSTARGLHRPHRDTLSRHDWGSQVGRTRAERRALAPDAFVVKRGSIPSTVLLIDDVITTGTTLRVCAGRLRAAGAKQVFVLAAARRM